jgi:hypothetical protein
MSEEAPVPVLKVLDADPVGFCEPESDYCVVPGLQAEAPESTEKTDPHVHHPEGEAPADFSRPTPVSSCARRLAATSP